VPSFVEKYPKIKYAISDRPHMAATGPVHLLITEWIAIETKLTFS
jgi:hypothetical protein